MPSTRRLVAGAGLAWLGAVAVSRALVEVEGWSMAPHLAPGDRLLTLPLGRRGPRAALLARLSPGAVVVVAGPHADAAPAHGDGPAEAHGQEHVRPHEHLVVKRVRRVTSTGLWVEGDHPTRSTDSRAWGELPFDRVRAVALARWPALWRRP
jgi:signal peptidase I